MSEQSLPRRKRDKIRKILGLSRSSSPQNSQIREAPNASLVQTSGSASISSNLALLATPSVCATSVTSAPHQANLLSLPNGTLSPPDLWFVALQTLSENDQHMIHPARTNTQPLLERVEELVKLTRDKQQQCEEGFRVFHFQGKKIILRDVAEKIVFWLNKFKDVGDIAVNFDPVHASLPWACVRFLLQAAISGHEQMGALLISVEKVAYLIDRCTVYECLYTHETTPGQALQILHSALVRIYAAILRLIALINRILAKNTVNKALYAVFNPEQLSGLLSICEDLEPGVDIEAQNCERFRSQAVDTKIQKLLGSLRTPTIRIDERVSSFLEKINEKERLEILDWISKVLYGKNHATVKGERTKGTCEWLLGHSRYLEWQDTSSSIILWLNGTAGTGKTHLISKVIDNLQSSLQRNPNHEGLAFFYCNRNESERQDPLYILRSFVRQLSTIANDETSVQKRLQQLYIKKRQAASELTMTDCKEIILELINLYPKTTLILDALDECDKQKRHELIETFDFFVEQAQRPVKIILSSRPDGDIKERFKSKTNIQIQAIDNQDDISRFVKDEITQHRKWKKISPKLQEEIIQTLQDRSQGISGFQWAYLQIKQLLELQQEKAIHDRLGKLPLDLKTTYDEIYNGMNKFEKEIADRAFKWVMCSCKPLTTDELLPAVCQNMNEDTIKPIEDLDEDLLLEYCHNLLVIDPARGVWIPSHLSVIEYFESNLWDQNQAHIYAAGVCLLLLNDPPYYGQEETYFTEGFNQQEDNIQNECERSSIQGGSSNQDSFRAFTIYVIHHWMIHVRICEKHGFNSRISALLKKFLGSPTHSSSKYQSWNKTFYTNYDQPESSFFKISHFSINDLRPASSPSFTICALGLYVILPDWWDHPWPDLLSTSGTDCSLLQVAAAAGYVPICERLVSWGVNANQELQDRKYGSALVAAVYGERKEIVQILLDSGADVNMQLQAGLYDSALAAAVYKDSKEIVQILLDSGADVNMQLQAGYYGSALAAAAYWDRKEIVQILLDSGADVNMQLQARDYGSALAVAVYWDRKEIVQILLDSGADINMQLQAGDYGSALVAAVYRSRKEIVQILLDSGADVNMQLQAGYYDSALAAAVYKDSKEIVQILLDSGADVNMQLQAGLYGSALAAAAYWDRKEIVQILLDSGADINMQLQAGLYGSALAVAVYWDRKEIVQILLDSGANVNMQLQAGYYGSALAAAVYRGRKEIVQILLDSGADVNMQLQAGYYGSALAAAVTGDSKEIVQILLDSGADVNMQLQARDYGSALAAAAYWDKKEIVQILLDSGANINMQLQAGYYGSALAAAAYRDWKEIAQILLDSGADVNMQLQAGDYGSALAAAAASWYGSKEIVQILLNYGAEVNMQLRVGKYSTALATAVGKRNTDIEQLLIEHGAV